MSMIHEITPGLKHRSKQRVGRGTSAGKGKTAGRGQKGSGARSGRRYRDGFIGGATENYRRYPMRGFSNYKFTKRFAVVNLQDLNRFDDGTLVDQALLATAGLTRNGKLPLKILGNGELTKKLTIHAAKYSRSAADKITAAGGKALDQGGNVYVFEEKSDEAASAEVSESAAE